MLLSCGESTIRFCPPLIVKRDEGDTAVGIFNYSDGIGRLDDHDRAARDITLLQLGFQLLNRFGQIRVAWI